MRLYSVIIIKYNQNEIRFKADGNFFFEFMCISVCVCAITIEMCC